MQTPEQCGMLRNRSTGTSTSSMFRESSSTLDTSMAAVFNLNDDPNYDKYEKLGRNSMTRQTLYWRVLPCCIVLLLSWVPHQRTRWQVSSKRAIIEDMIEEQKNSIQMLDETTERIRILRKDVEIITKDNELSFQEIHRRGGLPENMKTTAGDEEDQEVETNLLKRIDKLEKGIQVAARKRLDRRYGSGSHRVRVVVRDDNGVRSAFVIETADINEMPHSIDHFFRMIEKNLWDDLALVFDRSSNVVMATPMTMDNSHTWAGQRFVNNNLTHMAFTEYSPTFPPPHHRRYSVAFSGRPGGPNFYINMDDELEFAHEHESTFGVVLEGRDVLYKTYSEMQRQTEVKKKMLTIESMRILENTK